MSTDPVSLLLAMLPVKAIAYFFLIRFALVRFGHPTRRVNVRAATLVVVRMVIGLMLVLPLWAASTELSRYMGGSAFSEYTAYILVYGSLRWVAWSVVSVWTFSIPGTALSFVVGRTAHERLWRLAAVAVSFVADLPLLIGYGGPVTGKFFC